MINFASTTRLMAAAIAAAALGGCAGDGDNEGTAAAGPALGPLTGEEICSRLTPGAVSGAIGHPVTNATALRSGTPQCSYNYRVGSTTYNVTVAYQRPDGDLSGKQGAQGLEHVLEVNRRLAQGTAVQETPVQAGERAVRMTGTRLHLGVLLTANRVMTVTATSSIPGEAVDRLMAEAGNVFGR